MTRSMSTIDAERALDGAVRVIAEVRYCWLVAEGEDGAVTARPMGRVSPHPKKTDWAMSFVTDGRSRKAAEIRRSGKATLVFQRGDEDAYVALIGSARLSEEPAEVGSRWNAAYDVYFPTDDDRANAAFIDIAVERMDLWIRGVTPEPFGTRTTTLVRGPGGGWAVLPRELPHERGRKG